MVGQTQRICFYKCFIGFGSLVIYRLYNESVKPLYHTFIFYPQYLFPVSFYLSLYYFIVGILSAKVIDLRVEFFLDHVVNLETLFYTFCYNTFIVKGTEGRMTDILQNNCNCVAKYNKTLADKLQNLKSIDKNITIDTNLAGEYNLLIDGVPVHSLTGAVSEAKNIAASLSHNDYGTLHIIYGIGLGYLADEFIQALKGKVIVYEPDLQTLAFVLSVVDLSQNFKTGRLFLVSDKSELQKVLYSSYRYKSNATFSYLDYYKAHGLDFKEISDWLKREIVLIEHNYDFQVNNTKLFFYSTLKRLAEKYKLKKLVDYKDALKDTPAIIVSAGPSLSKNIDILKKYSDKAVIFCVGTALSTLYKNDITPDFANVIEKVKTLQHYNLPFAKDVSFICEQFSETSYLDIPFKEKFITNSLENDDARWFLEKAEAPFTDFETKGTVAYHALYCAYYLGCNPIILLGQDLAYSDGACYSKGSKFEDLECVFDNASQKYRIEVKDFDKFKNAYCASVDWSEDKKTEAVNKRLEKLNANLVTVKGQNDNLLPTDSVYSLFIDYLQDFASRYGDKRTLVNASIGGALINGFETLPLEFAVSKYVQPEFNKKDVLNSFYNAKDTHGFDISKVKKNIAADIRVMKSVFEIALSARDNLKKVLLVEDESKLDLKTLDKIIQNAAGVYANIVNNYMLKYRIIKMLMVKEYNIIAYLTRENPVLTDYEVTKQLAFAYYDYFRYCVWRLDATIKSLDETLNELENN